MSKIEPTRIRKLIFQEYMLKVQKGEGEGTALVTNSGVQGL